MAKDEGEQGGIDWEALERAAIEGEDDPTPEELHKEQEDQSRAFGDDGPSTRGQTEPPPLPKPAPVAARAEAPLVNAAPTNKTRLQLFGDQLKQVLPRVRNVIPKHVDPERLFAVAYVAMERNPKLLECTSISVLRGIIIGAQMGLDVSGIGGMAYLVPYRNAKTGNMEAQFIVGYRGMIDLARRGKEVAWIYANAVYANEQFSYEVNPIPRVYHKPLAMGEDGDQGEFVGTYAIAVFRDSAIPPQPMVMTKVQIDKIRRRSKAADSGPWVTDYVAMGMKTAVRALCKFLPQSPELAAALAIEDRIESGLPVTLPGELVEGPDGSVSAQDEDGPAEGAPTAGTDAVKRKIAKGRNARPNA